MTLAFVSTRGSFLVLRKPAPATVEARSGAGLAASKGTRMPAASFLVLRKPAPATVEGPKRRAPSRD